MDIEFQTKEEIKRFQEELLQKQVAFLAAHSAYYQRVFEAEHIQPESIRTLEDLHRLPFTV
jgi:phenylacetate-CoA ligase